MAPKLIDQKCSRVPKPIDQKCVNAPQVSLPVLVVNWIDQKSPYGYIYIYIYI